MVVIEVTRQIRETETKERDCDGNFDERVRVVPKLFCFWFRYNIHIDDIAVAAIAATVADSVIFREGIAHGNHLNHGVLFIGFD